MKVVIDYKESLGIYMGKKFQGIILVSENEQEKKLILDMADNDDSMVLVPSLKVKKDPEQPENVAELNFGWNVRE